jgi:hypothetical protein
MVTFPTLESCAAQTERQANATLGISARRIEFFEVMTIAQSCSPLFLAAMLCVATGPI